MRLDTYTCIVCVILQVTLYIHTHTHMYVLILIHHKLNYHILDLMFSYTVGDERGQHF